MRQVYKQTMIAGLEANALGEIRKTEDSKVLNQTNHLGYRLVYFQGVNHQVHRLVLSAFDSKPSYEQLHVNHIDSVRSNNRLENIEWCTHSENASLPKRKQKGVYHFPFGNKNFRVVMKIGKKVQTIGYFETEEDATRVYDQAHRMIYGVGQDEGFSVALLKKKRRRLGPRLIEQLVKRAMAA